MEQKVIDIYDDISEDSWKDEEEQEGGKNKEEVSSESDASSVSSDDSSSTVECLSKDPLFMVLSNYLKCSNNKLNIVDVLYKIHKDLKAIRKALK